MSVDWSKLLEKLKNVDNDTRSESIRVAQLPGEWWTAEEGFLEILEYFSHEAHVVKAREGVLHPYLRELILSSSKNVDTAFRMQRVTLTLAHCELKGKNPALIFSYTSSEQQKALVFLLQKKQLVWVNLQKLL